MTRQGRRTVSVEEICADLGVSRATVYRAFEDGAIPARRMGGRGSRWLVMREAYDRWLTTAAGTEQVAS